MIEGSFYVNMSKDNTFGRLTTMETYRKAEDTEGSGFESSDDEDLAFSVETVPKRRKKRDVDLGAYLSEQSSGSGGEKLKSNGVSLDFKN